MGIRLWVIVSHPSSSSHTSPTIYNGIFFWSNLISVQSDVSQNFGWEINGDIDLSFHNFFSSPSIHDLFFLDAVEPEIISASFHSSIDRSILTISTSHLFFLSFFFSFSTCIRILCKSVFSSHFPPIVVAFIRTALDPLPTATSWSSVIQKYLPFHFDCLCHWT